MNRILSSSSFYRSRATPPHQLNLRHTKRGNAQRSNFVQLWRARHLLLYIQHSRFN